LSPAEADRQRGGKTTNVLLEDVLRKQLKEINSIRVSATKTSIFTDENIERGILALKNLPMNEGYTQKKFIFFHPSVFYFFATHSRHKNSWTETAKLTLDMA
jgi:hypothetical protein